MLIVSIVSFAIRFGRRLPHGTFLAGGGVACFSVAILQWLGKFSFVMLCNYSDQWLSLVHCPL